MDNPNSHRDSVDFVDYDFCDVPKFAARQYKVEKKKKYSICSPVNWDKPMKLSNASDFECKKRVIKRSNARKFTADYVLKVEKTVAVSKSFELPKVFNSDIEPESATSIESDPSRLQQGPTSNINKFI